MSTKTLRRPQPARPRPLRAPSRRIERLATDVSRAAVPWPWVALAGAVVSAWIALAAVGGSEIEVAGASITISASGAAAGAGTAMLAGSSTPGRGRGLAAVLAGLFVLPIPLALAASGGDARGLVAALPIVIGLGVATGGRDRTSRLRAVALAGMGTALIGAGVFSGGGTGYALAATTETFGATLVAGGVLLVLAGAGGSIPVPALKPLMAVGLLAGLFGAAAVGGIWVPLLAGAAAVGVAGVRPATATGLLAVAIAALPGGQPSASLVAAGALIAVALDRDWAVIAALPGLIAMLEVLMFAGELAPRLIVGATAVAVQGLIAFELFAHRRRPAGDSEGSRLASPVHLAALPGAVPRRAERHRLPALVIGAWVLVAPGSWTWAGEAGLGHYDTGAGRAVGVGALVMVALACADGFTALRRSRMRA